MRWTVSYVERLGHAGQRAARTMARGYGLENGFRHQFPAASHADRRRRERYLDYGFARRLAAQSSGLQGAIADTASPAAKRAGGHDRPRAGGFRSAYLPSRAGSR